MTAINANCLCGKVNQIVQLKSKLPVEQHICHCDDCRYSSGSLGSIHVDLAKPPARINELMAYESSDKLTRYFCGTCATHTFCYEKGNGQWWATSGVLEEDEPGKGRAERDIIKIIQHKWVGDTRDGGLAAWLTTINGRKIPCFEREPDNAKEITIKPAKGGPTNAVEVDKDGKVLAKCHCGSIQFRIYRTHQKYEDQWFLRANGTKYRGQFCVCRSCRLPSGQRFQPWTYVDAADVKMLDGTPWALSKFETLITYSGQKGVYHDSCGKCGAKVFYRNDERSTRNGFEFIDVAAGLLRSSSGVRAEDWVEWPFDRISWRDEGVDDELIEALLENGKPS